MDGTGRPGVLVVEDERTVARLLQRRLEREGYEVWVAGDGLAACKAIGQHRPDLILLDVMLPTLDGWEVCSTVRTLADPSVARTPIIMLTSRATPEDRVKGLQRGADEYLTKPFSMDEVLLRVRKLLAERRREPAGATRDSEEWGVLLHDFFCEARRQLAAIERHAQSSPPAEDVTPVTGKPRGGPTRIGESAHYLTRLMEDLQLFWELDEDRADLPVERLAVQSCVEGVATDLVFLEEERGVQVRVETSDGPAEAAFNETAARVCFSVLLQEAIGSSPAGTEIRVLLSRAGLGSRVEIESRGAAVSGPEESGAAEPGEPEKALGPAHPGAASRGLRVVQSLVGRFGGRFSASGHPGGRRVFRLDFRPAPETPKPLSAGSVS